MASSCVLCFGDGKNKKEENTMKILREFAIILFVSFLGEILNYVIPLPIPASVYGMILMLLALCFGMVKVDQVKNTADFLIEIMPPMFIPAAVGLVVVWKDLKNILVPVIVIMVVSTVLVMVVTGRTSQWIIRRKEKGGN